MLVLCSFPSSSALLIFAPCTSPGAAITKLIGLPSLWNQDKNTQMQTHNHDKTPLYKAPHEDIIKIWASEWRIYHLHIVLRRHCRLPKPLKSKQIRWGAGVTKDTRLQRQPATRAWYVVLKGWRLYQLSLSPESWTLNPCGNLVKYTAWWSHCVADQKCHPALSCCQKEPVRVLGALTN